MGVKTYRKKSNYLGETSTEVFKQMFVHLQYALKVLSNGAGGGPKLVSIDPF